MGAFVGWPPEDSGDTPEYVDPTELVGASRVPRVCLACGVLVGDEITHDEWHKRWRLTT